MKTILILLCSVLATHAQLAVTVSPAKVTNQKVIVPLFLTNGFSEKIESARAAVFVSGEDGKVIGQGARWIIGGDKTHSGLAPGATNVFNFVITTRQPIAITNLSAKIAFSRLVLSGGKLADPVKDVQIQK